MRDRETQIDRERDRERERERGGGGKGGGEGGERESFTFTLRSVERSNDSNKGLCCGSVQFARLVNHSYKTYVGIVILLPCCLST